MKRAATIGGVIAACAACCALPFLLPLVGLSVGGGLLLDLRWDQVLCAVGAALAVGVLVRALRGPKPKSCATDGSCGCKPAD